MVVEGRLYFFDECVWFMGVIGGRVVPPFALGVIGGRVVIL